MRRSHVCFHKFTSGGGGIVCFCLVAGVESTSRLIFAGKERKVAEGRTEGRSAAGG